MNILMLILFIIVSFTLGWLAGCGRSELLRRYRK